MGVKKPDEYLNLTVFRGFAQKSNLTSPRTRTGSYSLVKARVSKSQRQLGSLSLCKSPTEVGTLNNAYSKQVIEGGAPKPG